ncbi:AEC family transporter [Sinimarinibacterium sp. NLF-5-8]|uniref:AEC family transporter n=1 Tax=Sinimarinibacterium sp. NLF-5-8 TaxID=2698684 RepID=UPI00137BCC0B|nr:AEC family transporter [Sinimarinibacterium sp. NLF-5-8]QHS10386.1 AEC family transporter [Sinimarinibacterium sp. NLF-5-8]
MSAFALLFVCLGLGTLVARYARPPMGLAQGLNWWVINIALPALVLDVVPQLQFDWQFWFLIVSQYLVFAGAYLLFKTLGARLGWSRGRIGALTLVCGMGNTSFMGYPLLEALRGRDGLALGVVADQLGCFIVLAVGGTLIAALYSGAQAKPRDIARRIALFPPAIALVIAGIAAAFGGVPEMVQQTCQRLGTTMIPLALFSVGLRFRLRLAPGQALPLVLGLGWKMALAPLLVWVLGVSTGIGGQMLAIGVLQAAMAPMVSATILADQHNLDPPLANSVLGVGILLALVTVPLLSWVLPA